MSTSSSKRAASTASRGPFGLPRISDIRIRSKLGLILMVPLIVLVGVAGLRVADLSNRAFESDDMATLVEFNTVASEMRYYLQTERAAMVMYLRGDGNVAGAEEDIYEFSNVSAAATHVDERLAALARGADNLPELGEELVSPVLQLGGTMELIDVARADAEEDPESVSVHSIARTYQNAVERLVEIAEISSRIVTDPEIARKLQVIALTTKTVEQLEEQRATAINIGDGQAFRNHARWSSFIGYGENRKQAVDDLKRILSMEEEEKLFYSPGGFASVEAQPASRFETLASAAGPGQGLDVDIEVIESYNAILEMSRVFISDLEEQVLEEARANRDAQIFQLLLETILILAAFVIASLVALAIARNMAGGLRRLREGALEVAHVKLPQAVAQMRDSESIGNKTPQQVVDEAGDPLKINQRDEIGNVAHSFNIVHKEAIRVAAEQAGLRASVSQMFINLARRSQGLVDRLIGHLDQLERDEDNPDRLAELFKLDHLATRMRRNDENLLVLAGADSTRQERHPAQISDILQAAQSEVEQYTRIDFGQVQTHRMAKPAAVNDMVHLVAELMDNSTSFSPPEIPVLVEARETTRGITIQVIDQGIGISQAQLEELNQQMREATDEGIDLASSRMMGLTVVARLAQRHGVTVELMRGNPRGTVAEVHLPDSMLVEPPLPGRHAEGGAANTGLQHTGTHEALPAAPDNPSGLFDTQPSAPVSPPMNSPSIPAPRAEPQPRGLEPQPRGYEDGRGYGSDRYGSKELPASAEPLMFKPGGYTDEDRKNGKVMEVTGEIVSSQHVALPKIELDAAPAPEPPPAWPAADGDKSTATPTPASPDRVSAVDETMELPIFREAESAWFKAATPAPRPVAEEDAGPVTDYPNEPYSSSAFPEAVRPQPNRSAASGPPSSASRPDASEEMRSSAAASTPEPSRRSSSADELSSVASHEPTTDSSQPVDEDLGRRRLSSAGNNGSASETGYAWRTAADDGWQQAESALSAEPEEQTATGLPKRRPGEKLVPGGVQQQQETLQSRKRNPEGVRGLLSAYHRGVQRGRGGSGSA
ncbi:sensor histidine kinase [Natronoglycomyces albus]|uniref:histidine kinase n=1 Tax=Natronoglycomyces albus TaxID=2811108 RepID=A0A895XT73_9ACTN|nr:ATP-binding protein [Natronoglycomyces albus]QSB05736.1 nitrate- and nitrite sensing domain-containing protein [Natronoglycomyces albus]